MNKNDQTLSTGQITGLLNIPPGTLQRYIREYKDHFSQDARKPNRGRRFTREDVQTILIIRSHAQRHAGKAEVIAALADPTRAENTPIPFDPFEALRLADQARKETAQMLAKMRTMVNTIASQQNAYQSLTSRFRLLWYEHSILKLELLRLKLLYRRPRKLPPPKKYDSIWNQFKRWAWTGFGEDTKTDVIERSYLAMRKAREEYLPQYSEYKDYLDPDE